MSRTGIRCDRTVRSRVARFVRVGAVSLLLWGGIAGTMVIAPGAATAQSADGTLTVQVLRDFFGSGVISTTMDVPQRGMIVTVTDPAGHLVQAVTDATGKVTVAPSARLAGGQYRVDVSIPAPYNKYLRPAPASTKAANDANHFDSFVSHVDLRGGTDASVITGVWNPNDYALPDSKYYVPVQTPAALVGASPTAPTTPADPNDRALVSFGQDARGTCPEDQACPDVLDTQGQVGATWGLAYDKYRGRLFQAAFARRLTAFGPGGGGAIYTVPLAGGAPSVYATVPAATITPHDPFNPLKETGYVDVPGKEGIGGIALTEDGQTLYAVNLLTKTLVSFDATGTDATVERTVPIPDPGCASPTDWRPFAVAAHDAKLYLGGVCSAESTQQTADLKAVVYTYNGATFTPVLQHALNFPRGYVLTGAGYTPAPRTNIWNPWSASLANWDAYNEGGGAFKYPEPELASLAFSRNGSMMLGFRDRFMDVGGGGFDPRPGVDVAETAMSGGDLNMACARPTGGYDWEGEGSCPNNGASANNGGESADVVEYFPGDYFPGGHQEASQGSVAYIPQQQYAMTTELDPARYVNADGVGFYDVDTGIGPGNNNPLGGFEFVSDSHNPNKPADNGFAKAGGLGDVAYAAANAPIQIGNIVWFDGDHNGIQDPYRGNEVPLSGATVNLLDTGGSKVATTSTDAAGEYYFGGVGADYTLTQAAKYTVQFDVCTANTDNVPTKPAATKLRFTLPTAGSNRAHDSNVVPPKKGRLCNGFAPVTAPAEAGGVDHTIDAGVYIPKAKVPAQPGKPGPGGVPVHTGGSALSDQSGSSGNWWWLALAGFGVLLSVGAGIRMIRTSRS